VGAYGYLVHAFAEGDLLRQIAGNDGDGSLRLRCAVPPDALPVGGLTIYGRNAGDFQFANCDCGVVNCPRNISFDENVRLIIASHCALERTGLEPFRQMGQPMGVKHLSKILK